MDPLESKQTPTAVDYFAPDGSEIRLLPKMTGGGLCHVTLPAKGISKAVKHKTVEEIWYFLQGQGQVWRKLGDDESVGDVGPGVAVTIPTGAHFQFQNLGNDPLCFLCVTMPPWPGKQEAKTVKNHWPIRVRRQQNSKNLKRVIDKTSKRLIRPHIQLASKA